MHHFGAEEECIRPFEDRDTISPILALVARCPRHCCGLRHLPHHPRALAGEEALLGSHSEVLLRFG